MMRAYPTQAVQTFPFRERDYACIHPDTYKYFLAPEEVAQVWRRLEAAYGESQINHTFRIQEIETPRLFLRSTTRKNPITVIRKRRCTDADIQALHELVGYHG